MDPDAMLEELRVGWHVNLQSLGDAWMLRLRLKRVGGRLITADAPEHVYRGTFRSVVSRAYAGEKGDH